MRKNLALILSAALMITMMSNAVIPALASEGSADDPYKLILTEEPKPSSGSRKAAEMPAHRLQQNPLRMRRTMFPSPAQTRSIR